MKNTAPRQTAKEESSKRLKFKKAGGGNQIAQQQVDRAHEAQQRILEQQIEAPEIENSNDEDHDDSIDGLRRRLQARIQKLRGKRKDKEQTKKTDAGVKSRRNKRARDAAADEGKLTKKPKLEADPVPVATLSSTMTPPLLPEVNILSFPA